MDIRRKPRQASIGSFRKKPARRFRRRNWTTHLAGCKLPVIRCVLHCSRQRSRHSKQVSWGGGCPTARSFTTCSRSTKSWQKKEERPFNEFKRAQCASTDSA